MQHHDDPKPPPATAPRLRWKVSDKLLLEADWAL